MNTPHNQLARCFAALVRATFTPDDIDTVNGRNAHPDYAGACATHDFCDANALMYGAWCALAFETPDMSDAETADAMNAAWNIAKRAGFDMDAIPLN